MEIREGWPLGSQDLDRVVLVASLEPRLLCSSKASTGVVQLGGSQKGPSPGTGVGQLSVSAWALLPSQPGLSPPVCAGGWMSLIGITL